MTVHNQTAPHAAPKHRWAWRLGAAVGARRWPKRLAVGVAAWIVLGVTTAWLDPWTTGLVSLLGGVGAWLSVGVGLMVTALVAHGSYRRHGVLAALATAAVTLAVTGAVAVLVDWSAVGQAAGMAFVFVIVSVSVMYKVLSRDFRPSRRRDDDVNYYGLDGYRHGSSGWGYYVDDMKIH